MSKLRLDHPNQDIRIGQARAACANQIIRLLPDASAHERAQQLLALLALLGLLPGQNPDRMISTSMRLPQRGADVRPRVTNVGTTFGHNYY